MGAKQAFTLVELLVVIGIISVLIAILLPAINRAMEASKTLACLSGVRQISVAAQMYAGDNKGFLPRYTEMKKNTVTNAFDSKSTLWDWNWTGLLLRYVGENPKVYECPARKSRSEGITSGRSFTPAPGGRVYGPIQVHYQVSGVNVGAVNDLVGAKMSMPFGPVFEKIGGTWVDNEKTMKLSSVASDTIMVTESVRGDREQSSRLFKNSGDSDTSYPTIRSFATSNHGGRVVNVAFADGHAETLLAGRMYGDPKLDVTGTITPSTPSGLNSGSYGDLQLPNNTNRPRGYWTAARND